MSPQEDDAETDAIFSRYPEENKYIPKVYHCNYCGVALLNIDEVYVEGYFGPDGSKYSPFCNKFHYNEYKAKGSMIPGLPLEI